VALRLVTPPLAEPVSLAEAKAHLRVDTDSDDALIARLITAARGLVEAQQRRALVTQTWDLTLDGWPEWDRRYGAIAIRLPLPPCQSVGPITYLDPNGVLTTMPGADYVIDLGDRMTPARVQPLRGRSWPALARVPGAVTVRFIAGYGAAEDVPATTRQAILLLVGHYYDNREAVITGATAAELPMAVAALLAAEDWGSYP
jgi:uncharacterized phiE125 gp8 family phage protein